MGWIIYYYYIGLSFKKCLILSPQILTYGLIFAKCLEKGYERVLVKNLQREFNDGLILDPT